MKIGLYGGTFDPPHNAHLRLASWVHNELGLDYLYFIPAAIHALKDNSNLSPALTRLKLVEKAIEGDDRFRVSRIEIDRQETSYTAKTLQNFIQYENLPECDLIYIMGFDNLVDFHRWKNPDIIMELAKIVVLRRAQNDDRKINKDIAEKVSFLNSPLIDLSSTDIRYKIRSGSDVSDLVPSAVLKIITEDGLYLDQE